MGEWLLWMCLSYVTMEVHHWCVAISDSPDTCPDLVLRCCNDPCQFTPLLQLSSVVFGSTPFGWLPSVTLTHYFLWKYHYSFTPTFSGTQLERKTRAGWRIFGELDSIYWKKLLVYSNKVLNESVEPFSLLPNIKFSRLQVLRQKGRNLKLRFGVVI